jgi:hypothetical protein
MHFHKSTICTDQNFTLKYMYVFKKYKSINQTNHIIQAS